MNSTTSTYQPPPMTPAGNDNRVPGFPFLRAAPQADVRHVDLRVLRGLNAVGRRLGRTITIISGYRSPAYSASVGGYATDPHTRGVAADAYISGQPVGDVAGAAALLAHFGLESGAQPGFYHGQSDPEHVQVPGSGINKALHALWTLATGRDGNSPTSVPSDPAAAADAVSASPVDGAAAAANPGCLLPAIAGLVSWAAFVTLGIGAWVGWW